MAAKTWSRTVGDANWSTGANWNAGTVPATTDVVTFDVTSILDCTVDALGTFTGQIIVAATYAGTITQNVAIPSTAAFSIAGGTWVQAAAITRTTFAVTGGTFTGGSQSIGITGTLTFSGGTLTMTSGTCTINAGNFTQTNSPTFNHNSGTIHFAAATAATLTGPNCTFFKITFTKTNVNFTVAAGTTCPLGTDPTNSVGAGDSFLPNGTVTWTGNFTLTGTMTTASTTTLTVSGTLRLTLTSSLTFHASSTITANLPITFSGSTTATVTATAYTFATCTINRNAQLTVAASTTIPLGASPSTQTDSGGGTNLLVITGTVTLSGTWTHTGSFTVTAATGVVSGALTDVNLTGSFTHSTGTFPATIPFNFTGAGIGVITATTYTFGTCVLNKAGGGLTVAASTTVPFGASPTLTGAGGTLTITGTVTASGTVTTTTDLAITISAGGSFSGGFTVLNVSGSLNISATATTLLNGVVLNILLGASCTITATASAFGTCVVNKTGATGTFTLAANTTLPLGANPSVVCSGPMSISGILDGSGTLSINQTSGAAIGCNFAAGSDISDFTQLNLVDTGTLTFNATSTIVAGLNIIHHLTGGETTTFAGNGKTFGFLRYTGNGSTRVITGSNTFTYIQDNDPAMVNHDLTFQASTTQTFTDAQPFRVRGTATAVVTVNSSTSTNAVLTASNAAAYISCRYLFVDDVTVDAGPPVWYAGANSTSSGDAPNWVFTNNPADLKRRKSMRIMT